MVTSLTEKSVFKNNSEISQALHNRANLFKEINSGMREPIDRTVFHKSIHERNQLYSMKTAWKQAMIECFPDPLIRKTYNNPLCK